MSAQVNSRPETPEDLDVWLWVALVMRLKGNLASVWALAGHYKVADTVCAHRMWEAQLSRGANPYNPAGIRIEGMAFGARWSLTREVRSHEHAF